MSASKAFHPLLWSERPPISSDIPNNLSKVLRIGNDVDVSEKLEIRKVIRYALLLQTRNKRMIRVEVRDDLEPALE